MLSRLELNHSSGEEEAIDVNDDTRVSHER
jgi:hypothetical protein